MTIKAVIFDLDDTLYDSTGLLMNNAMKRAVKAMVENGLPCTEEKAYEKLMEIAKKYSSRHDILKELCGFFGDNDEKIKEAGFNAYNSDEVEDIWLFPDVIETLGKLRKNGLKLILITAGLYARQKKKIKLLKLEDKFDLIIIADIEKGTNFKYDCFMEVLKKFNLKPEEVLSVGDRIHSEIRISNKLEMVSVRMLHGRHKNLVSSTKLEKPSYEIKKISEIMEILKIADKNSLKIVVIGGGTGLPMILKGLKKYTKNLTAIVTVTDSGRSSGILRRDFGIPSPGDIRNCLIALSGSEKLINDLLSYRFENGDLKGHSFGNLFITSLANITGSFENAIKECSKILNIDGQVLPSTLKDVHICAELLDGSIIEAENNIIERHNKNVHLRPRIKRVFLKPEADAFINAIEAIEDADLIVIGPGCLYTSIISNLLVKDISKAILSSKAKKVYICNIMTQPSQTQGFKAKDHINEIIKYLNGNPDYIIVNNAKPNEKLLDSYRKEHAEMIENNLDENRKLGIKIIEADILENIKESNVFFHEKLNLLRHDSDKIAKILIELA